MTGQILVPFEGEGAGVEDLTWGQIGFWQGIAESGRSLVMGGVTPLTPGVTVEALAESLRFSLSRHQSLRTRLRLDPAGGLPKQVCSTSGVVPLEVVDVEPDGDPATVAEEVFARYEARHFDYEREWPIRMAAIRHGGRITHGVAVYLHTAIDAGGLEVLLADLAARDPMTGAGRGAVTAMQPLAQARQQRNAAARRTCQSSLRHLEHVLRTVSLNRFGEATYGDGMAIRLIRYHSPATAMAIKVIAAHEGTNTSAALLAGFAVGLARFTGNTPVMAMMLVSNRFRPGFAESVSPLVQVSPYLIDVADISLAQAVGRAKVSVLNTYKNAYYDPYEQDAVIERVNVERGAEVDLSCFYNDRRQGERGPATGPLPTAADITAALEHSDYRWEHEADPPQRKLYFNVDDPPGAIDFAMSVDTRYFDDDDMITVLRGIEAATVQTALDPTASTGVRTPAAIQF
ncbi:MAG TPA: condensation domain-containing protein [Pseudonocardiaceae bacterium]|jgi:hypothetical protein